MHRESFEVWQENDDLQALPLAASTIDRRQTSRPINHYFQEHIWLWWNSQWLHSFVIIDFYWKLNQVINWKACTPFHYFIIIPTEGNTKSTNCNHKTNYNTKKQQKNAARITVWDIRLQSNVRYHMRPPQTCEPTPVTKMLLHASRFSQYAGAKRWSPPILYTWTSILRSSRFNEINSGSRWLR